MYIRQKRREPDGRRARGDGREATRRPDPAPLTEGRDRAGGARGAMAGERASVPRPQGGGAEGGMVSTPRRAGCAPEDRPRGPDSGPRRASREVQRPTGRSGMTEGNENRGIARTYGVEQSELISTLDTFATKKRKA